MQWPEHFDVNAIYWQDYRQLISALPRHQFPDTHTLNRFLPERLKTASGKAVRFVKSTELPDQDYERRIFSEGIVSTRPDSWHDLFNALVWIRFPQIKIAINTLHNRAQQHVGKPAHGKRGPLRDALTLFDECGVILISSQADVLQSITNRDWQRAFQLQGARWHGDARLVICGHAMLEKLLTPYKSMTAKALLIQASPAVMQADNTGLLQQLDMEVARQMLSGDILQSPCQMTPLPLAGIPGWDFAGEQNPSFYADSEVFRAAPQNLQPAPIVELNLKP